MCVGWRRWRCRKERAGVDAMCVCVYVCRTVVGLVYVCRTVVGLVYVCRMVVGLVYVCRTVVGLVYVCRTVVGLVYVCRTVEVWERVCWSCVTCVSQRRTHAMLSRTSATSPPTPTSSSKVATQHKSTHPALPLSIHSTIFLHKSQAYYSYCYYYYC